MYRFTIVGIVDVIEVNIWHWSHILAQNWNLRLKWVFHSVEGVSQVLFFQFSLMWMMFEVAEFQIGHQQLFQCLC